MDNQEQKKERGEKDVETPLMKQYYEIKKEHPDAVLLFRVGDFYETFGEDAVFTSKALNIVLTRRSNGSAAGVELAGFPHHALESYLYKLVKAGGKVAICEQLEDPKLTKKLVKRGVTELITPGVALNDKLLENGKNNFLACVYIAEPDNGLAFLDVSTGEFYVAQGPWTQIRKLLDTFSPSEILLCKNQKKMGEEKGLSRWFVSFLEDWVFKHTFAKDLLLDHFKIKTLKCFGIENLQNGQIAAGACLHYLKETKHDLLSHINRIQRWVEDTFVWLDASTIRNLELIESNSGALLPDSSLFGVLNRTISPMGQRLLRRFICMPLQNKEEIEFRLHFVEQLKHNTPLLALWEKEFSPIGDLERLLSKVASFRANPREIRHLLEALTCIERIKKTLETMETGAPLEQEPKPWQIWAADLDPCEELQQYIQTHLQANVPSSLAKGQVVAQGVSLELDELRHLAYSGKDYLAQLQQREAQRTGISSLKLGFNSVFGYYLEVTHLNKEKVPENWTRKQTLTSGERYITEELKEYEQKVLHAQEKITVLEAELYQEILRFIQPYIQRLQANAHAIAFADVMYAFAKVAGENNYVKPEIGSDSKLEIREGRHPVIERNLPASEAYVPNSLSLQGDDCQIMMITGPNMSGKSAVLRQTALIVLMAQMGSFVPASAAKIGIVDKVFTRVGASDNIALGESTFMVEMNETANILHHITSRSLVLLDEIGRGTSTYDGISIAWAIAEFLHQNEKIRPKVLFATHYHELNQMAETFERIKNYHISVLEKEGEVLFLRKLVAGGSEHSFGIHVAQMAGMPQSVVKRAEEILSLLEDKRALDIKKGKEISRFGCDRAKQRDGENILCDSQGLKQGEETSLKDPKTAQESSVGGYQLSFIQLEDPLIEKIKEEILDMNINDLTPLQALNKLNEIKTLLKKD